jgi:pyruvate-formate lyase-activating enzyme
MSLRKPTNLEQFIHDKFEDIKVEICNMKVETRSFEERIVVEISTKLEEVFAKTNQDIKCMKQQLYQKLTKKLDGMRKLLFQLQQQ